MHNRVRVGGGGNLAKVGDQNVLSQSFVVVVVAFCVLFVLSEKKIRTITFYDVTFATC